MLGNTHSQTKVNTFTFSFRWWLVGRVWSYLHTVVDTIQYCIVYTILADLHPNQIRLKLSIVNIGYNIFKIH